MLYYRHKDGLFPQIILKSQTTDVPYYVGTDERVLIMFYQDGTFEMFDRKPDDLQFAKNMIEKGAWVEIDPREYGPTTKE